MDLNSGRITDWTTAAALAFNSEFCCSVLCPRGWVIKKTEIQSLLSKSAMSKLLNLCPFSSGTGGMKTNETNEQLNDCTDYVISDFRVQRKVAGLRKEKYHIQWISLNLLRFISFIVFCQICAYHACFAPRCTAKCSFYCEGNSVLLHLLQGPDYEHTLEG